MKIPQDKIQAVQNLVKYTRLFETKESGELWAQREERDENGNIFYMPEYSPALLDFIEAVLGSGILEPDYINVLNENSDEGDDLDDIVARIDSADFDLRAAVLTCVIRQERFSPGLWGYAVNEKWFGMILTRMNRLMKD